MRKGIVISGLVVLLMIGSAGIIGLCMESKKNETISAISSENMQRIFDQGMEFFQKGEWMEAKERFQIVSTYGNRVLAEEAQKYAIESLSNYQLVVEGLVPDKVIEECKRYISRYPDGRYVDFALYHIALSYQVLGKWDKAESIFLKLMEKDSPLLSKEELEGLLKVVREVKRYGIKPVLPDIQKRKEVEKKIRERHQKMLKEIERLKMESEGELYIKAHKVHMNQLEKAREEISNYKAIVLLGEDITFTDATIGNSYTYTKGSGFAKAIYEIENNRIESISKISEKGDVAVAYSWIGKAFVLKEPISKKEPYKLSHDAQIRIRGSLNTTPKGKVSWSIYNLTLGWVSWLMEEPIISKNGYFELVKNIKLPPNYLYLICFSVYTEISEAKVSYLDEEIASLSYKEIQINFQK